MGVPVTPKKESVTGNAALKRDRDRFVALAFCAADLLIEVEASGEVAFSAGAAKSLLGVDPESLVGIKFLDLVCEEDRRVVREVLETVIPGARIDPMPVRLNSISEPSASMMVTGYHLPDRSHHFYLSFRVGGPSVAVGFEEDFDRDEESGLFETQSFAQYASRQIRQANRRGETLKLTLLRVPELEELRSRLDQETTDQTMQEVGACLKANAAEGQAAGAFDDGAYGFLHKESVDVDQVSRRIENVFQAADPSGQGISVDGRSIDADIGDADPADTVRVMLYTVQKFVEVGPEAFESGSLKSEMQAMARDTSEKLAWFRQVTRDSGFDVAFQPIVNLKSRTVHHYEALARFDGKIDDSPYETIAFAETAGVITEFDLAMAKRVLEWLDGPGLDTGARVAVNVSGRSVASASFPGTLHSLLNRYQPVRSRLIFEITESAYIEDLRLVNEFICGLKKAGHSVCLDDFGAGSAALRYLQALEVDTVKIDGHYVRAASKDLRNRNFLKAVAGLCHDLEITTIAEMVEDDVCADMLISCNVEYGQGHVFGKPAFELPEAKSSPKQSDTPQKTAALNSWQPDQTRSVWVR